jgi:hypothetical protein
MKRRKKKRYAVVLAVSAVAIIYFGFVLFFTKHYFFNTIINGENYSADSVKSVQNHILDTSSDYVLEINGRDQLTDTITSADIALRMDAGDAFTDIIDEQNAFKWPASIFRKSEYTVDALVTYSKEELERKIDTLCFFKSENIRQPQNAYLSDYTEDGFQIVPEDKGTVPIREKIYDAVEEAVQKLAATVDLDEKGCYKDAPVASANSALQKQCEQLNHMTGVEITYTFGDEVEVLDGNTIKDWLVMEDDTLDVDPELVREYVNALARKYDTWGRKREFRTTSGETITIAEGAYGWWMNRPKETEALIELIRSGKSEERIPIYHAQAAQYGEDDIGDSYVEIDLTSQHLWVYEDGVLVEETDFVSGNVSRGYNTPVGIYGITYKERNTTLRGANYASKVSYWMPFNGNVGMHDASWRNSFGADIYLRNGSHGCVNLPSKKAEKIYEYVEKGEPVIVYGGQTSVPKPETSEEPETVMDPEEAAFTELTQEQQIQLLIEAGLLNPDGTPVQQPQETLPQTPQETLPPAPQETLPPAPQETLPPASQEILPPAPQDIPVENIPQIPPNLPQEGLPEQPQNTSEM